MRELTIEKGIIIDDIDSVLEGISKLSGKPVPDAETVKKFITNEKNTKFYINDKCACKMQPERDTVYLWLDSGFTDYHGNPIMISLLNNYGTYTGHYFGTMNNLANNIKGYFSKNLRDINKNLGGLKGKYEHKAADRIHKHIVDEQKYLLDFCNGEPENSIMADIFKNIEITVADSEPETEDLAAEPEIVTEPAYDMNFREKEITVGLLLDTIDGMQKYIDELLGEIEKFNSEDKVRLRELEAKNEEYKRALVQMRTFVEQENVEEENAEIVGFGGHELLGRSGKILVLGATDLDINTMNGIAKLYGFEKKDFEFETDYKKVVSFAGRINNGEKYAAIILGACPHKVARLGDWSSIIEKCKQSDEMPSAFDARSLSGELKVTKESFKMALLNVCRELKSKAYR